MAAAHLDWIAGCHWPASHLYPPFLVCCAFLSPFFALSSMLVGPLYSKLTEKEPIKKVDSENVSGESDI